MQLRIVTFLFLSTHLLSPFCFLQFPLHSPSTCLLTWRSLFLCSWCEYPSTLVPGWLSTVLPLLPNPPQRHPTDQATYLHRWNHQHQLSHLIQYCSLILLWVSSRYLTTAGSGGDEAEASSKVTISTGSLNVQQLQQFWFNTFLLWTGFRTCERSFFLYQRSLMMMIKLFITFSVHFLGYNLQYYYIHTKLYILIYRPPLFFHNLFILLCG